VKTQQQSIFSLDQLNYLPDNEEIELLMTYSNIKWWDQTYPKVARNAVANMFAHISLENKEFSHQYISTLINLHLTEDSRYIRQVERILLRIVQVKDKF
jgi:hypothetical protein